MTWTDEQRRAIRLSTCVHFCGVQKVCDVGIIPATVRDESQPGKGYRWPCLLIQERGPASTTCSGYQAKTDEDLAREDAEVARLQAEMMARSTRLR